MIIDNVNPATIQLDFKIEVWYVLMCHLPVYIVAENSVGHINRNSRVWKVGKNGRRSFPVSD